MSQIPDDLKELCSQMLAPRNVGGGVLDAADFWPLIERIGRVEGENAALKQEFTYTHMVELRNAIAATDESIVTDAQILAQPAKLAAENARLREVVMEIRDHLYEKQDYARVRGMARNALN